ncbi:MAG TPA: LOG family protein, partial [Chthoniobacterales bacterium]|nr:LOG family protein [Chthoniobacterales bacterium]
KIKDFPVVVMGTEYWRDLLKMFEKMADEGMIDRSDLDLFFATDSVEEAISHIRERAITPFGLKLVVRRTLPWLGESGLPVHGR